MENTFHQPLWVSHRGGKGDWCENTKNAFQEAVANGYRALETDLRPSLDGVLVLSHDASLARLSQEDMVVEEREWGDLKQVSLADGQGLMSFPQFWDEHQSLTLTLDIKPDQAYKTIDLLKPFYHDFLSHGRVRFLFWKRAHESLFQKTFPGLVTLARESECILAGLAALGRLPLAPICPHRTYALPARFHGMFLYKEAMIRRYHARKARVIAYLPSHPSEVQAALHSQCDEILSDSPRPALAERLN